MKEMILFVVIFLLDNNRPVARLSSSAQNGKANMKPPVYPVKVAQPPWPLNRGKPNALRTMTMKMLRKALRGVRKRPDNKTANVCSVNGMNAPPNRIEIVLMTINSAANKAINTSDRMVFLGWVCKMS